MSVSSEGRGNLKWGILLPTEQLARPQGSCAPVPGYSEFPKCGVSLRASLGTGSHGPRGLAECLIEDSRDRKGWVGTLLRVCRGGKVPEARVHSLALLSGFPLTSSRLWGIPGYSDYLKCMSLDKDAIVFETLYLLILTMLSRIFSVSCWFSSCSTIDDN